MAYLNANIPVQYAQIKKEYLYDLKKHHGEVCDCVIFGISSITGRAILFHALMENGAVFYRLPISAFIQCGFDRARVPEQRLDELELWNSFSYYPAVNCWDILDGQSGKYFGKDKKTYHGKYLFTIDFAHPESNILDTEHSEVPHEHKCAHILALENGNYAAQPNNRLIWSIPSFTVKDDIPDWKVQTNEWNVEDESKWRTEDTDKYFYEIEEKK
jgi:hypothetical protein